MTSIDEANIPVLTEIISADQPTAALASDASAATLSGSGSATEPATPAGLPAAVLSNPSAVQAVSSEMDWDAMELTVREAVLKQVLTRVDFVLEHRVRDGLADVLQTAVDKLADEIRTGLANSLSELVTRSVQQELLKLRSGKS